MDNAITQKILFEIEQIDELISESSPLFDLCKIKEPDFIERCGIAMILHSFYNGIENILKLIIRFYDKELPTDVKWHTELLEKAFVSNKNRKEIFSIELQGKLEEYLKFRHFVRHSYGFQLKWEKMESLVTEIYSIWEKVKNNINVFMEDEK